ncbi:hypothetical protein GCM10010503_20890 [Streptomyces lucensis JCM 4490]|uniref:Uncharacterized protein n=1 Tax=Streptomyces lucensis JCM 4490 TaxID=1306176 RepID=A0A918MQB8_9ACTN|nr:hypothetical protein GCM10010503_20890 [Streptomyces lucensis JCM 4490]
MGQCPVGGQFCSKVGPCHRCGTASGDVLSVCIRAPRNGASNTGASSPETRFRALFILAPDRPDGGGRGAGPE